MSDAIPPALTPEEWRRLEATRDVLRIQYWNEVYPELFLTMDANGGQQVHVAPPAQHALAALALHGQPFGFTYADVGNLRMAAELVGSPRAGALLLDLAERIAALLPPP